MSWQVKPLGEICEFQRGLTYAKGDEVDESENVVLRANNVDLATNRLDLSELRFIRSEIAIPEAKKVKKGSLIVCTASGSKSHLGKVALVDEDYGYAFGGFMGQITPKPGLSPNYLFHLMTSMFYRDFIDGLSDGANINNLKFDDLGRFNVPFPNEDEQHRIVAILDKAFADIATARANAEKNIKNPRYSLEAYLETIFASRKPSWIDRKMSSLCREVTVGYVGPMKSEYVPEGVPFLRSQNIRPFEVSLDNLVFVRSEFHRGIAKSRLGPGDLAIVRTGYPGTAAVIPDSLAEANCSDLVIMRPGPEVNPHFLAAFFNSAFGKRTVMGKLVGAAQKHFNVGAAKDVVLHLPSMEEQDRIVAGIAEIRAETSSLESLYARKLAALDELKQSLLQQAFSGNI